MNRKKMVSRLSQDMLDVLIIGAGINGSVSAASLSTAGLKVAVVDKGDFASGSSSASSNLIWGGIKYLENREYSLVWNLCASRNRLINAYPSRVRPVRFQLACPKGFRKSATLLYLGAWVYWYFGRCFTKTPKYISKRVIDSDYPFILSDKLEGCIEYSDAFMPDNDARFCFQFIRKALQHDALALNYMSVEKLSRQQDHWEIELRDRQTEENISARARLIINASGPYAEKICLQNDLNADKKIVWSKGVHLIVDRITKHEKIFAFFADDGRPFFLLPMGNRSCIGTTDTRIDKLPAVVTDEDRDFILCNINRQLKLKDKLSKDKIIAERVGVRPLVVDKSGEDENADWTKLSRKHVISNDAEQNFISIYGGKFTDCINIGNAIRQAASRNGLSLKSRDKWYGEAIETREDIMTKAARLPNTLTGEHWSDRLWRLYGPDALKILQMIEEDPQLKENIIPQIDLMYAEVHYARDHEMISELDDLLSRRQMISWQYSKNQLTVMRGIKRIAEILFEEDWQNKYDRWLNND